MTHILYSFRRCPYAIRARMALSYAGITTELREVWLRDKPEQMLLASPKGTVPVLVLETGEIIEESFDVMLWAVQQNDPDQIWHSFDAEEMTGLVEDNDLKFKHWLDRYKYADRYPEHSQEHYREQAERFLEILESRLEAHAFLFDDRISFADVAIFPFVRQFAFVDAQWFESAPYPALRNWLNHFLEHPLFTDVMNKYRPWRTGDKPTSFPAPGAVKRLS